MSNRKWPHNDPFMTLNDLQSIFNMIRMPWGSSMSNFSSIGACWKFDLWPIDFDLWGHNHHRCTVHWMFYQISYDWPGISSRCWAIADFFHLTLYLQVPKMMTFDLIIVSTEATLVNGLSFDQITSTCYNAPGRYEYLKILDFGPEMTP